MADRPRGLASSTGVSSGTVDTQELGFRVRAVAGMNPYMAANTEALTSMAMMPVTTDQLVSHAGQLYAMQTGNKLADQLKGLTPGTQRAIYDRLTPGQQQAMASMGYQTPNRDESSLLGSIAHVAAQPLKVLGSGVMAIPGLSEAVGGTMEGLSWVGNQPGHLYRTMRMQDQGSQWAALAGGLVGLAAVAAAIPTGGGSLMALGALGMGALGGASAASAATSGMDWVRAFNSSWNGEKTFDIASQHRAEEILGDPRAVGAAHDLSAAGIDVVDFAKQMVGTRAGTDRNAMLAILTQKANSMAAPGSPQNQQLVNMMTNMLKEPSFQEAIQTLNNGKISPGRDLAHSIGLDQSNPLFNFVSGGTDALFTVSVDPTLLIGAGAELALAKRMTFSAFTGSEAAEAFKAFVYKRPTVLRSYENIASAVEKAGLGGLQEMQVRAPQLKGLYGDLIEYKQLLKDTGHLDRAFDADHVIDYLSTHTNFQPLLEGKGAVKNVRGLQLIGDSAPKMMWREFRGEIRAITNGMSDSATEAKALRLAQANGADFEMSLPPSLMSAIGEDGVIAESWRFNQHNPYGYSIGRAFGDTTRRLPLLGRSVGRVGEVLTSMTTMALPGKGIHLVGEHAVTEIKALSEYGRFMGLPSFARQAWADTILSAESPAARMDAIQGWMANAMKMTGIDSTEEGRAIVDNYLEQSRKIYGEGDDILVNGHKFNAGMYLSDQADIMVMPNLHEMAKATRASYMAKYVFGVAEHPMVEAAMTKFWKPMVLLRIGFIPRAAGEEFASFALRGGIGSLLQESGARYIGARNAFDDAMKLRELATTEGYAAKFTNAEQALLDKGWVGVLPAHVRPVVRMLQRVGFEDPSLRKFDDYANALKGWLETGLGKDADPLFSRLGGQALDAPRFADTDVGRMRAAMLTTPQETTGAAKLGLTPAENAERLGIQTLSGGQLRRLNVADYANSILLGNPYSLRRMMIGGVHNDLVEAGTEWARTHATTVMRETSAITSGPMDPGFDHSHMHTVLEDDPKTGDLRPVTMMIEKGRKVVYAHGDPHHAGAVLENITRSLQDPVLSRTALAHLSRVRSPGVEQERLGRAVDDLFDMGKVGIEKGALGMQGHTARRISAELLDSSKFSREHWSQLVTDLAAKDKTKVVGQTLATYLPSMKQPTIGDITTALKQGAKNLKRTDFDSLEEFTTAQQDLARLRFHLDKRAQPTVQWLEGLPVADRRMASAFIYEQLQGGEQSFWAQRKLAERSAAAQKPAGIFTGAEMRYQRTFHSEGHEAFNLVQQHMAPEDAQDLLTALESGKLAEVPQAQLQNMHDQLSDIIDEVKNPDDALNAGDGALLSLQRLRGQVTKAITGTSTPGTAAVSGVPEKWLYDSLDEAFGPMVDDAASLVMNPHMHDHGVPNSLRAVKRDAQGQFLDTHQRAASVNLFDAPNLSDMTFQQVLDNARNRELVLNNRKTIEELIAKTTDDSTPLLADYQLATELHAINVRAAGLDASVQVRPHMLKQDRRVTDGRIHGTLFPNTESAKGGEVQLWHMPKEIAQNRLMPTPDELVDPAREWAQTMTSRLHDTIRRANKQTRHARGRVGEPLADGSPGPELPLVHTFEDGNLVPIQPGGEINLDDSARLRDHKGRPIAYGDPMYTEDAPYSDIGTATNDPMWEALGPAMMDNSDLRHGRQVLRRKQISANPTAGDWHLMEQSNDLVPLTRTSIRDISDIPGSDLPMNAIGEVYKVRKIGGWDKMVQYGFDRVIGPSIDAIVRKPMSFHAFANRFVNAKQTLAWTLDPELVSKVDTLMRDYSVARHNTDLDPEYLATIARSIAHYDGDTMAAKWTVNDSMAWMRSHTQGEMDDLLERTITRSAGQTDKASRAANAYATQFQRYDFGQTKAALGTGTDLPSFLKSLESRLPEGALRSKAGLTSKKAQEAIKNDPLMSWIQDNDQWDTVLAAKTNHDHLKETAGELAAVAAIGDVVPFLDSHEFKTQFADYGKAFLPFWYAEENFMKRWARGLADEGFPLIRRAQLTYMGMKSAGVVRTDQSGRDWFVYPGSGLLVDAIQRIPGMAGLQQIGVLFESPTDQMLPGINNRFGTPSFSPLVTIPMEMVVNHLPELQPVERSMLGDFASTRKITDMIIPAHFRNIVAAATSGEGGNPRYASAMITAMSWLDAHGQGLKDNATPGEVQDYQDRIRKHARIVVLAQAIGGFFTPGSPQEIAAGSTANMTGIGVEDPERYLSTEYSSLVHSLGIEAGTQKYLELNADATVDNVVSPLAYTVSKGVSTSGAPIPTTEQALAFTDQNADYFGEFPNAAPWLLPQQPDQTDRSQYAYDQQITDGLRQRRTPEEFYRAMKFKLASTEYFAMRDGFNQQIDKAQEGTNKALTSSLTAVRDYKLMVYRMNHPIFAEELQSSDGRAQRARTLTEMRTVVDDPAHPPSPHFDSLRQAMHSFDTYKTRLSILANDNSTKGKRDKEFLKQSFESYMGSLTDRNPEILPFWVSVLRPESSLD